VGAVGKTNRQGGVESTGEDLVKLLTRFLQVSLIIFAAVVLLSRQAPEKASADLGKYGVVQVPEPKSPLSDTWQRTKECTAQVEKTRGKDKDRVNHYSPKYDRCFVRVVEAGGFFEKTASTFLLDVFEGSIGAIISLTGPCYVGGKEADCAKAEEFIADAMTN
jgi:hypothetical protein